jgi:hypothetical protein
VSAKVLKYIPAGEGEKQKYDLQPEVLTVDTCSVTV